MDEDVRSAFVDAYSYHYGQVAMDYVAGKYWSGDQAAHLEELLDRLAASDPMTTQCRAEMMEALAELNRGVSSLGG